MTGPHANPYAGRAPAHLWKTAMARAPGGQVAPTAGQAFRLPAATPTRAVLRAVAGDVAAHFSHTPISSGVG